MLKYCKSVKVTRISFSLFLLAYIFTCVLYCKVSKQKNPHAMTWRLNDEESKGDNMLDRDLEPDDYEEGCPDCADRKYEIEEIREYIRGYMTKLMAGDKAGALDDLDEACGYLHINRTFIEKFFDWTNNG
jgi:hypothetical protein